MSEFQFVGFRAVDRPVSEKNLGYMRQQSTRAEITPWSFENEYHFGDFRGNAEEMLRRGYDVHLHYASFGTRKILIRLPRGLQYIAGVEPYFAGDELQFSKDKSGPGGILAIDPYYETDDLSQLWEIGAVLDDLVQLRTEILGGDLRPLYLAHLAVASDMNHDPEETIEAPVPAGLKTLSRAQRSFADLYDLSESLIDAAAQESSPMPERGDPEARFTKWLRGLPETKKNAWLASLMIDVVSPVRTQILAEYQSQSEIQAWPTSIPNRTIAQILSAADTIADAAEKREAANEAGRRAKRRAQLVADPAAIFREAEKLVTERTKDAYRKIGELLSELREALSGTDQAGLAETYAQELKAANPKVNLLIGALRQQKLLPKR